MDAMIDEWTMSALTVLAALYVTIAARSYARRAVYCDLIED